MESPMVSIAGWYGKRFISALGPSFHDISYLRFALDKDLIKCWVIFVFHPQFFFPPSYLNTPLLSDLALFQMILGIKEIMTRCPEPYSLQDQFMIQTHKITAEALGNVLCEDKWIAHSPLVPHRQYCESPEVHQKNSFDKQDHTKASLPLELVQLQRAAFPLITPRTLGLSQERHRWSSIESYSQCQNNDFFFLRNLLLLSDFCFLSPILLPAIGLKYTSLPWSRALLTDSMDNDKEPL